MKVLVEPRGVDCVMLRVDSPYTMSDQASVDALFEMVFDALGRNLKGRKAYLLVDLSKVTIGPGAAKFYGVWSKKMAATYALGVIRFGVQEGMTKAAVLAQSIINHYTANVYADLQAAEAVVQQLRGAQAKAAQK